MPWVELSLSCAHTDGFDCACWIVHHRVSDAAWLYLGRSSGRLHMGAPGANLMVCKNHSKSFGLGRAW